MDISGIFEVLWGMIEDFRKWVILGSAFFVIAGGLGVFVGGLMLLTVRIGVDGMLTLRCGRRVVRVSLLVVLVGILEVDPENWTVG